VKALITIFLSIVIITGCSHQTSRYQQATDSSPVRIPTPAELHDAVPRIEPYSRGGNKDYQVRGNHYKVLPNTESFEQTGIASWYGKKFHGHLTSNGEIYDMFGMSAAHKNLPLPTYLKVTNLSNNKTVIVRVNDRGPFHPSRIIDLSYSAAYKLDMLKTGTANVKITPIQMNQNGPIGNTTAHTTITSSIIPLEVALTSNNRNFIQVFATKDAQVAKKTANALSSLYQLNVRWPEREGIFRVQIGPINEPALLDDILSRLKQSGYPEAYTRNLLQ
jgi:rare lipoprotein A